MEDMADNILKSNWKNITTSYIRPRHSDPQPYPYIQVNPTRTRDSEGNIKERPARSAQESLIGTQQKHQNWADTAGENTTLHGCTEYLDAHGNIRFNFQQHPTAPTDEDLNNLFRPDLSMSRDIRQKCKDAHNPATAELFNTPPTKH